MTTTLAACGCKTMTGPGGIVIRLCSAHMSPAPIMVRKR